MSVLTDKGPTPWLRGYEEFDYSELWRTKAIEDLAQKRIIRSWVRPGGSCLELGGGFGRITRILEPSFDEILMVDLTRRNLEMAKRNLTKAGVARADVSTIPARDSAFDTVVMVRVIHHLLDPQRTMMEIKRVAKNRATFIMSVPNLMTNYMVRQLPSPRNVLPAYGSAVWPLGERPSFSAQKAFVPSGFEMTGRKGTGLFDNFAGKALNRFPWLHLVDVATSPLWFLKLDVFLRYQISK